MDQYNTQCYPLSIWLENRKNTIKKSILNAYYTNIIF